MSDDTLTPPERCPVCGAIILHQGLNQDGSIYVREYACEATWATYRTAANPDHPWHAPCRHAMTAALRTGATLEPTPLEQARQALVDAAVIWRGPDETVKIENDLVDAVDAYLALLEPAP